MKISAGEWFLIALMIIFWGFFGWILASMFIFITSGSD